MLLPPTKNGLTSLFKEVRVFKVWEPPRMLAMRTPKNCLPSFLFSHRKGLNQNNHKGGTVTGEYGFVYVSDMYPSSF